MFFSSYKLSLGSLLLMIFLLLTACGKSPKKSSSRQETSPTTSPQTVDRQQPDEGTYKAVLQPLNAQTAGETTGTFTIKVRGDDFYVESQINGAPSGVKHLQNIHTSAFCPDATADKNQDSYIDVMEAMGKSGEILIPLDSDISDQLNGIDYGPIANNDSSYVYRRSTSLSRLLSDLRAPDPDPLDGIAKLPAGEELNLSGKVVMVYGVKEKLPSSVSVYLGFPKEQALPIACGVLMRQ